MKKRGSLASRNSLQPADPLLMALEEIESYCAAHWGSPSAVWHPRLFIRSGLWVALLGPSVEEGIVGIGPTVEAALRAFDAQYLAGLRPSSEADRVRRAVRNAHCMRP